MAILKKRWPGLPQSPKWAAQPPTARRDELLPQTEPRTASSASSAHLTWPGGSMADPYEVPDSEDDRIAAHMILRRSGSLSELKPSFGSNPSPTHEPDRATQPAAHVLIDLSQDDSDVVIETPHRLGASAGAQPCLPPQLIVDSAFPKPAVAKRKREGVERSPPMDREIENRDQESAKRQKQGTSQADIKQTDATTDRQSPKGRVWPSSQSTLTERAAAAAAAAAAMTPPNSEAKPAGLPLPCAAQPAGLPRTRDRMITQFLDDAKAEKRETEPWQEQQLVGSPQAQDTACVHFFPIAAGNPWPKEANNCTNSSSAKKTEPAEQKDHSDERQEKSERAKAALKRRNRSRPSSEMTPTYRGPWPQEHNGASVKFTPHHRDTTIRPRSVLKTPSSQTFPSPATEAAAQRGPGKSRSSSSRGPSPKPVDYNSKEEMAKSEAVVNEIKAILECKAQKKAWDEDEAEKKRRDEEQLAQLFARKPHSGMKLTPIPKVREAYFLGEPLMDASDSDSDGQDYGWAPSDSGSEDYWQGRELWNTWRDEPEEDHGQLAREAATSKQRDKPTGLSAFKPVDSLAGSRRSQPIVCHPPTDDEEYWEQRRRDRERQEGNAHAKSNLAVTGFAEVDVGENKEELEKQAGQEEEEEDEAQNTIPDHQVDPVSSPASPGLYVLEESLEDVFAPAEPCANAPTPPAVVKPEPSSLAAAIDASADSSRKTKGRRRPRASKRVKTAPFGCQVRRRRLHDRPLADTVNDPQVKILVKGRNGTEVRSLSDVVAMFALQGTAAF